MSNPTFDLHILGWKAFEDLATCIFRDIFGQTVQVFAEGKDGGRDAALSGISTNVNGKTFPAGNFCVQCKHTSKASKTLPQKIVDSEIEKIQRLVAAGLCDVYFLVTNYSVPAELASKIEEKIINAGAGQAIVYGAETLNQIITENSRLRRLVPRIYGLGDLTQIVTNQAYCQAKQVLETIAPDLNCFVPTAAYRQCAHALQEHGFVLLVGEPASGKTMIANLMALSAADEWNLQTLMLTGPADFSKFWNPDDPGQFLWVDDAFGVTQYDSRRVAEWNIQLPKLKAAIKSGARVVFTSRDYIFSAAKNDLKISAFELFDDSRVVINVENLTSAEREMILYNHLNAGSQPKNFKKIVKNHLEKAARVPKFLPEISRRFGHPRFTKSITGTEKSITDFFEKPVQVLAEIVKTLASAEKAALGFVFMSAGKLPIPLSSNAEVALILDLLDATLGEVKSALTSLDDSLLKRVSEAGGQYWTFRHPTIRDAYASVVGQNPELIDVYLKGVSTERLLSEVVCGTVKIQGAKIIVPGNRYDQIMSRLRVYSAENATWPNPVTSFLASRCDANFLVQYYKNEDLTTLIPNYLSAYNSEVQILASLCEAKILPESIRLLVAKRIIARCEADYSCTPLEFSTFKILLKESEIKNTIKSISENILANSDEIIENIKSDWEGDTDPYDIFSDLDRTLELIEWDENFNEDEQAQATAIRGLIDNAKNELSEKYSSTDYEKLETEEASEPTSTITLTRSIFDDVDE